MDPIWRIDLFGGIRVTRGEAVTSRFRTQKTAALLGYLAYTRRAHSRDVLTELFWPDAAPDAGRHNLSVALSSLRQQLEPPGVRDGAVLVADRATVALDHVSVAVDTAQFAEQLRTAGVAPTEEARFEALAAAVDLYRGELMAGYYEAWIFQEQQLLKEQFLGTVRRLASILLATGQPSRALQISLRAVSADPLSEELRQEVMRVYLALGQPAGALRQYRDLERLYREELDSAPSLATHALALQAQEGLQSAGGAALPAEPNLPVAELPDRTGLPQAASASGLAENPGGAVPIGSPLYCPREADGELLGALKRGISILLLKGPRQVGKTSLLARGLADARGMGARVISTDFQSLSAGDLATPESLLRALAQEIADQLDLDADLEWGTARGPTASFRRFLRRDVLEASDQPLVWGLDEVDRLFPCPFHSEIFGLFRSWHNQRALDPSGPWSRLTQVIAYATEAHLFITDLHQSPFNVGTRVELVDFTLAQTAELNRRYGSVLAVEQVGSLQRLVGGHPYLVQQGLSFAARHPGPEAARVLETGALSEDGPFAEHLRRLLLSLGRAPELCAAVREVLRGQPCPTADSFYRLRSSGILVGATPNMAKPRCKLYEQSLRLHLLGEGSEKLVIDPG